MFHLFGQLLSSLDHSTVPNYDGFWMIVVMAEVCKKKNCDRQFRKLIYGLAGKVLNNLSATIMINNNGSRCYYEEIILLQSNEAMILDSDFTDRESVPMFFSSFILD
ncbi:hypothetical protein NH340_JMT01464 [Sarcoptes scabiei]|nr:hypothetical protein NH340_JMT01464 [Sarcoptes scabiei]